MAVSLLRTIPIIKQPIITCFSLKLSAKSRTNRVDCWLQVKKRDSKEEKTRIEENRIIKISFLSSTWRISQNMSQAAELLSQKQKRPI